MIAKRVVINGRASKSVGQASQAAIGTGSTNGAQAAGECPTLFDAFHQWVLAHGAHALHRPDAQAVPGLLDAFEGQQVDVDELRRLHQVGFHHIQQGGAAGQVGSGRGVLVTARRLFGRGGLGIAEIIHFLKEVGGQGRSQRQAVWGGTRVVAIPQGKPPTATQDTSVPG